MTEGVSWSETKAWQASALEVQRDMQELGSEYLDEGRALRPATRHKHKAGAIRSNAIWRARRSMKELTPILGLATLLLERDGLRRKPSKHPVAPAPRNWSLRLTPLKLSRAASHVAIALFIVHDSH